MNLNPHEVAVAERVQECRTEWALEHGLMSRGGGPPAGSEADVAGQVLGAKAELAAARELDLYPRFTPGRDGGADLSHGVSVRATKYGPGAPLGSCLLVRPGDPQHGRYLGTHVSGNTVRMLGWCPGREAMVKRWWQPDLNGRPGCWLVPPTGLHSLEVLEAVIAIERLRAISVPAQREAERLLTLPAAK